MNTANPTPRPASQPAKAVAAALLEPDDALTHVEARMHALVGNRNTEPGAVMVREHLGSGGKRLRARLALASCQALGGRADDAVDWAAAVELLHNGSLVHDDIQDGDRTRRGRPALWARYGAAQAINAGDLLLMLPFRALGGYPAGVQSCLVQILAEYAESTVRGQIRELTLSASADKDWGDYFSAVSGKTGTLFALPVRGGAELAGLVAEDARELASAFSSIGVLYQLQDDLLDLFESKGRAERGSDVYEGRLSGVVLTHLDLHPEDAQRVFSVLERPRERTGKAEVDAILDSFISGGAGAQLLARIEHLASELLASDALRYSEDIHAVATALVARVLAPIEAVKGGLRV